MAKQEKPDLGLLIKTLKEKNDAKASQPEKSSLTDLFVQTSQNMKKGKPANQDAPAGMTQVETVKKAAEPKPEPEEDTDISLAEIGEVVDKLKSIYQEWMETLEAKIPEAKEKAEQKAADFETYADSIVNARIDMLVSQSAGTSLFEVRDKWLAVLSGHNDSLDFSHLIKETEEQLEGIRKTRELQKAMTQKYGYELGDVQDEISALQSEIEYTLKPQQGDIYGNFKNRAKMSWEDFDRFCCAHDLELIRSGERFAALRPGGMLKFGKHETLGCSKTRYKKLQNGVKKFMKDHNVSFEEFQELHSLMFETEREIEALSQKIINVEIQIAEKKRIIARYEQCTTYLKENKPSDVIRAFDKKFVTFLREQPAMRSFLLQGDDDDIKVAATLKNQEQGLNGVAADIQTATTNIRATYESLYALAAQIHTLFKRIPDPDFAIIPQDAITALIEGSDSLDGLYQSLTQERDQNNKVVQSTIDYYNGEADSDGVVLYDALKSEHEDFSVLNDLSSKAQDKIDACVNTLANAIHTTHRILVTHNHAPAAFKRAKQLLKNKR